MDILNNWRFLIIVYILIAGVWSFLVKIASTHLNPWTMAFVALTSAWLTVAGFSFSKLNWQSNFGIAMAAICGCLGGISALLFYHIIKKVPASIVIPVSSLYIVVTVILSYFILGESISIQKIVGIVFGLIAIVLLTT